MTPLELLKQGREYLSDENHWQKGYFVDDTGTKFCSMGILRHLAGGEIFGDRYVNLPADPEGTLWHAHSALQQTTPIWVTAYQYNDDITHAELLEWWDRAIAHEETRENTHLG